MRMLPTWLFHRQIPNGPPPPVPPPPETAPVAESADINDLNLFPPNPVAPEANVQASRFETFLFYWTGTDEELETDTFTIEPLVWDGSNNRWTRQSRFTLNPRVAAEVGAFHSTNIRMRVHAVAVNVDLRDATFWVTGGQEATR